MSKKHILIMIACCLVSLAAAAAIFLFKVSGSTVVWTLLILICPLSHLLMMRFMAHDHTGENHQQHENCHDAKQLNGSANRDANNG